MCFKEWILMFVTIWWNLVTFWLIHSGVKTGHRPSCAQKKKDGSPVIVLTLFTVRQWLQVVAVTSWFPKGWTTSWCNPLNLWVMTFNHKTTAPVAWRETCLQTVVVWLRLTAIRQTGEVNRPPACCYQSVSLQRMSVMCLFATGESTRLVASCV